MMFYVVNMHTEEYDIIQLVKNDNDGKELQQHITPEWDPCRFHDLGMYQ